MTLLSDRAGRGMKATLTEHQLRQLILERARQTEGCEGISSVGIYKLIEPGFPNWTINVVGGVGGPGAALVGAIARDLSAHYDIQWPAEEFDLTHGASVFAEGDEPGKAERLYGATLLDAIRWARSQQPETRYSVWLHEPGKEPRPLLVEELALLFKRVPSTSLPGCRPRLTVGRRGRQTN